MGADESKQQQLRQLPSVDRLLGDERVQAAIGQWGREAVVAGLRAVLERQRQAILDGGAGVVADVAAAALALVARQARPSLQPVINATGVVIHTNLGRAPLSQAALAAMAAVGAGYSNLEYDLEAGARGSRYGHVGALLAELSGAEAALVVNNAAAALFLALATFAGGREVVISRAHLVEIGGGFRIPDILRQSGAMLREVGTTNRTYAEDYGGACGPETALLLRVHASNFLISGFVHQPSLAELAEVAHHRTLLLVDDLGSGALLDTRPFGLAAEPMVQESVAAGCDLVIFSGDKLLGGPQAGCLVGRGELIGALRRHPLARALRVDKTTLAGLDATLRAYQRGTALVELPVWRMIAQSLEELEARAQGWAARLAAAGISVQVLPGQSAVGGGSLPGQTLPTWLLALAVAAPNQVAAALRAAHPAIVARVEQDQVCFDPRTVLPEQDEIMLSTLQQVLAG
jgi:L-seryl-tRNA(Ser) seleniumtransferase